jgi:hypothetical protein
MNTDNLSNEAKTPALNKGAVICWVAKLGMRVIFIEDYITEGGLKRAKKGNKGTVVCKFNETENTIIKVDGKHYPIHDVPLTVLQPCIWQSIGEGGDL